MITPEKRRAIIALHTDPVQGSPFWIEYFKRHRLSVEGIADDPFSAPLMDTEALRQRPIEDFIPRKLLAQNPYLITGETSGFSGKPIHTVFSEEEFHKGFVETFLSMAEETGFPVRAKWFWIGPSGPHVIGKAVRAILRAVGGMDPFAIDFDPRWFRKTTDGSLSQERYFKHIEEQIFDVLDQQTVDVLFATPPVVQMLAEKMQAGKRAAIRGVHYGGMSMGCEQYTAFREAFPNAVHLSGYGNSLFGVFIEEAFDQNGIHFRVDSERVAIDIVKHENGRAIPVGIGDEGTVMFSRFDETFMILNMLERDIATKTASGLRDPHPPQAAQKIKVIY